MSSQTKPSFEFFFVLFACVCLALLTVGFVFSEAADSLALLIKEFAIVTDPTSAIMLSAFSLTTLLMMIFVITVYVYRRMVQKENHRKFFEVNPHVDQRALYRTIRHMKKTTSYSDLRFRAIGGSLANSHYADNKPRSPFAAEVAAVYNHFMDPARYPLPKSACPRK